MTPQLQPNTRARFCPTCDGTGLVGDDDALRYPTQCPVCEGCGWVKAEQYEANTRHDDAPDDEWVGLSLFTGAAVVLVVVAMAAWAWLR